ncbi:MAG: hypothetical protein JKX97_07670 [Candidatus Lindowbacteria bacterium]|nr:hypothetical protein [Candidatus Lindowbacteria bacterium]
MASAPGGVEGINSRIPTELEVATERPETAIAKSEAEIAVETPGIDERQTSPLEALQPFGLGGGVSSQA